jgi:hypothetical protein
MSASIHYIAVPRDPTPEELRHSIDQLEALLGDTPAPWLRSLSMSARIGLAQQRGAIVSAQTGAA